MKYLFVIACLLTAMPQVSLAGYPFNHYDCSWEYKKAEISEAEKNQSLQTYITNIFEEYSYPMGAVAAKQHKELFDLVSEYNKKNATYETEKKKYESKLAAIAVLKDEAAVAHSANERAVLEMVYDRKLSDLSNTYFASQYIAYEEATKSWDAMYALSTKYNMTMLKENPALASTIHACLKDVLKYDPLEKSATKTEEAEKPVVAPEAASAE